MGNNEWLVWPQQAHYIDKSPLIAIVHVNNVHDVRKWRSWPPPPHGSRFVVVSGENAFDDVSYVFPFEWG
jgi:hypothetical protein